MSRWTIRLVACALAVAMPAAEQDFRTEAGAYDECIDPPELISRTPVAYPPEARAAKVEGRVVIFAYVDTSGRVARTRVVSSIALLDDAALQSVRQWVFKPAPCNGRPKAMWIAIPIRFALAAADPPDAMGWLPDAHSERRPADPDVPCAEILRQSPGAGIARGQDMAGMDGEAQVWAACKRAETLEKFRDRSHARLQLEEIDGVLAAMNDEVGGLGDVLAGVGPGSGLLAARHRAQVELGFARIAQLWLDGSADQRSDSITTACSVLEDRIARRVGTPQPWNTLMALWGGDSTLVRQLWSRSSQPYLRQLRTMPRFHHTAAYAHDFNRASLEILRLLDRMNTDLMVVGEVPRAR